MLFPPWHHSMYYFHSGTAMEFKKSHASMHPSSHAGESMGPTIPQRHPMTRDDRVDGTAEMGELGARKDLPV